MFKPLNVFVYAAFVSAFISLPEPASAQPINHQISLPASMTWCDDSMINSLFSTINAFRTQHGVAALSMDPVGMEDAEMRAVQFALYMATANPQTPGFNPHQGYDTTAASLGYNLISEDLAYITSDPNYIVNAGWQDPLHLAALLASDANVAGVSCVNFSGIPFWTYEPGIGKNAPANPVTPPPPPPAPAQPISIPAPTGTPTLDSEEWAFLSLINTFRAQNGAGPLQVSVLLQNSSQWMSNDLATNNYFSHTDSLGRSTGQRLVALGYPYSPWGENIAAGYSDAQDTFNQWLTACDPDASGTCTYAHRTNMLYGGFTAIGIARASNAGSTYGWYWTTDFGGVLDQAISPGPGTNAQPPVISSFRAVPSTITGGQAAALSWSVSGATTISIDNGIGDVSNVTSKQVSPVQTTTYKLTATNSTGPSTALVTVAVNSAGDTQPPTAPTITSAVVKSSTEVDLAWTASSDNVGVTGYQIVRNGSVITSVAAAVLAFGDMGAGAGTTYAYTIKAFDAAGNISGPSNSAQVTTPAPPVTTPPPPVTVTCPGPATGAFTGCYYNNITLTGTPVLTRTDSIINFDWGTGSPDPSVTRMNFSVRWQGSFYFDQGDYSITAITSDGMRIYIDGALVLDSWRDQAANMYTLAQTLSQGNHLLVVEYYEHTGAASAHVSWQNNTGRGRGAGQAPAISSFAATPASIAAGQPATLSWSVSGATAISLDNGIGDVSSLTSKQVSPIQTTTYKLTATNAAGSSTGLVTITVNSPTRDTQPPTAPTLTSAVVKSATEVDLAWTASADNVAVAGYQIIRNGSVITTVPASVLTYPDTSASASATYTYTIKAYDGAGNLSTPSNGAQVTTPAPPAASGCPAPATGAFTACYYNGVTLTGAPVLTRTDPQINFDWTTGSPDTSVTPYSFSVRWQGYFNFGAGDYTFTVIASDGIRMYIDGVLVLDSWRDQSTYVYTIGQTLTQGNHLVVVEHYEHTGTATAHVSWQAGTSTSRR